MEEKELFEEAEKLLEATTLSRSEKNIILNTTHKNVKRYFYSQYDKLKRRIDGKYSDDEVIRKVVTGLVRKEIEQNSKDENQER